MGDAAVVRHCSLASSLWRAAHQLESIITVYPLSLRIVPGLWGGGAGGEGSVGGVGGAKGGGGEAAQQRH